jgi:16S rRNA (adenine(1408)-N(1))-methyltransferase
MADSSLRAARRPHKGGLPNALFVVAAAARPPQELTGVAAELTITFPWGSLLRATLATEDAAAAAAGIAALLAPGGNARALLSIDPRDGLDVPLPAAIPKRDLVVRWQDHGLDVQAWRPASSDEIAAAGSSWARRLGAGRDRAVWRLDLQRPPSSGHPGGDG